MITNSVSGAMKSNPKLSPLNVLIGEWKLTGKHPLVPGVVLHGHTSFKWIEGGAFMMMRQAIRHEEFPAGIALFGSDDSSEEYAMIYFDEREVSRQYRSILKDNAWKWWRDDTEFSQRFTGTISDDGDTIVLKGELSEKGGEWKKDLELTYTRVHDNDR